MKTLKSAFFIVTLLFTAFFYSCEKKEPSAQPDTDDIMVKIFRQFPEYDVKNKDLTDLSVAALYSEDSNKPVDLSKIEQYSVCQTSSGLEIGIFKLFDKTNSDYVKEMSLTRLSKMQSASPEKISNDAEARSYGNYVYYVSHPQKDKIFEIIEDSLRAENDCLQKDKIK